MLPYLYGQTVSEQTKKIINEKEYATKYGILQIELYESKINEQQKDSTLILSKKYDSIGNILEKIDFHYKDKDDFEHRLYFYDSLGLIKEEYSTISFVKNHISDYYKYEYDSDGLIVNIYSGFGKPGKIKFTELDSFKEKKDSSEFCQYDSLGKLKKVIHFKGCYNLYEYTPEGQLGYKKTYVDDELIETLVFDSNRRLVEEFHYNLSSGNKKHEFRGHFKSYYKSNGLIDYTTEFSKNLEPIKIYKYYYKINTEKK